MRNEQKLRVRARLLEQGLSLRGWARQRGYSARSVYAALSGERRGPKSRAIVSELLRFACRADNKN